MSKWKPYERMKWYCTCQSCYLILTVLYHFQNYTDDKNVKNYTWLDEVIIFMDSLFLFIILSSFWKCQRNQKYNIHNSDSRIVYFSLFLSIYFFIFSFRHFSFWHRYVCRNLISMYKQISLNCMFECRNGQMFWALSVQSAIRCKCEHTFIDYNTPTYASVSTMNIFVYFWFSISIQLLYLFKHRNLFAFDNIIFFSVQTDFYENYCMNVEIQGFG